MHSLFFCVLEANCANVTSNRLPVPSAESASPAPNPPRLSSLTWPATESEFHFLLAQFEVQRARAIKIQTVPGDG